MVQVGKSTWHPTWALTCLLLLVSAGCLGPTNSPTAIGPAEHQAPSTKFTVGAVVTNASWQIPWDGNLGIKIRLEASHVVECRVLWAAWGVSEHLRPTFGIVVESSEGRFVDIGRGQGNFDASVHAQAAGAVDQEVLPGRYGWETHENRTFPVDPQTPLAITGFAVGLLSQDSEGLRPRYSYTANGWDDDSVLLRIACTGPVTVASLGMGTTVVVFDESGFTGGAGAHFHASFDPSGATIASTIEQQVVEESGVVVVELYGDFLLNHVSVGVVEIHHPDGSEMLIDHPTQVLAGCATGLACPLTTYVQESGSGSYGVAATYASVELTGILHGAIIGYNPMDALPTANLTT